MKKTTVSLLSNILVASTLFFASSAQSQSLDRVVATIDSEPILESEIIQFAKSKSPGIENSLTDKELREVAQLYVADELLQREAVALGVRVLDEEIANYVNEIKKQNGVSDEQFNQLLSERGISREKYDRQVKIDILKSRIVSRQIRSAITISTEQVERYLEENPDRRPAVGSIKFGQIFLPANQDEAVVAEVEKKLADGESLQKAGGPFYSDVDFVDPKDLRDELSSAVEKLKVGEKSEAIKTDVGTYFIELASRVDEDGKIDGAITEEIKNELFEKEFQEKLDNYLTVELPKKYLVEFKL